LRELGYRVVGPATSALEARQMINRNISAGRPFDCALVHVKTPGVAMIASQLASAAIPFVWIARAGEEAPRHLQGPLLPLPCDREALLTVVTRRIAGPNQPMRPAVRT